jgi:hypothetical protein
MAILDRVNKAVATAKSIVAVIGWLGLTAWVTGLAAAFGGAAWAMINGISAPIIIMAVFCTITAGTYLAIVPMAFRILRRIEDAPLRIRPSPEIWQHVPRLRLFEAACLLADIDPDLPLVSRPGDANGWYRAICEALLAEEIERIPTEHDPNHIFIDLSNPDNKPQYRPYEETVISRDALQAFAKRRGLRRAFLLQDFAP